MQLVEFNRFIIKGDIFSFYFKIFSNGNEYDQRIEITENTILSWGCTCPYGSFFRFSRKNMENDTRCKHIKFCLKILGFLGYLK